MSSTEDNVFKTVQRYERTFACSGFEEPSSESDRRTDAQLPLAQATRPRSSQQLGQRRRRVCQEDSQRGKNRPSKFLPKISFFKPFLILLFTTYFDIYNFGLFLDKAIIVFFRLVSSFSNDSFSAFSASLSSFSSTGTSARTGKEKSFDRW